MFRLRQRTSLLLKEFWRLRNSALNFNEWKGASSSSLTATLPMFAAQQPRAAVGNSGAAPAQDSERGIPGGDRVSSAPQCAGTGIESLQHDLVTGVRVGVPASKRQRKMDAYVGESVDVSLVECSSEEDVIAARSGRVISAPHGIDFTGAAATAACGDTASDSACIGRPAATSCALPGGVQPPSLGAAMTGAREESCGVDSGRPLAQQPVGSESEDGKGVKCAVCLQACVDMCVSRCGHVACRRCWDAVLTLKQECPVCRTLTRPKFLTRVFLN